MPDWSPTGETQSEPAVFPADGTEVEVITPSGWVQRMFYQGGLWFVQDRSMYVYYTPPFWRYPKGSLDARP